MLFSAPKFADHVHAARYATKYLIKTPEHGYPSWVLEMGKERRIRRYSTSRGFWNNPPTIKNEKKSKRKKKFKTYAQRISNCGDSLNVFEIENTVDKETGELAANRKWIGKLDAPADIGAAN